MPILVDPSVAPPFIPPPPQPVERVRNGMRHVWTGWDGSVWELSDTESGLFLLPGIRGLGMPLVTHYRSTSPVVNGSQWRGMNVGDREVFWPLRVDSAGSEQDWIARDAAFWATMRPDQTGTYTVIQASGSKRSIDLRFSADDTVFANDPSFLGRMTYGVTLEAEQPFWRSDPVVRTFVADDSLPFFGPPGIVNISSGSQIGSASINNPGDVAGWVTWTLSGPFDSAVVGVAGKTISLPFPLAFGEVLTIWTQPDLMVMLDGAGVDRTDDLGAAAFTPVPPSGAARLSLSWVGQLPGASIEASLTPYFYRAW